MTDMDPILALKQAARTKDAQCAGRAVDKLRLKGFTYKDCLKFAKAGNPNLTDGEWEDLMMEADAG